MSTKDNYVCVDSATYYSISYLISLQNIKWLKAASLQVWEVTEDHIFSRHRSRVVWSVSQAKDRKNDWHCWTRSKSGPCTRAAENSRHANL